MVRRMRSLTAMLCAGIFAMACVAATGPTGDLAGAKSGAGKGGRMAGKMKNREQRGEDAAPARKSDNPMHPGASREVQEKAGLFPTGLTAVYPREANCLEVKSFFGDKTRYDGSFRTERANHGYHGGFDISSPEGTPLIALADGEVVHVYSGERLVGNQLYLRHAPEDTGLPFWIYSKYKHFKSPPDLAVGDRVRMGQVLGYSGKTGTVGGHYGQKGYPHLHLSIYASDYPDYKTIERAVVPQEVRYLDPLAIYLPVGHGLRDNFGVRALPEADKKVVIPYKTSDGRIVPQDTRLVWPYLCDPK